MKTFGEDWQKTEKESFLHGVPIKNFLFRQIMTEKLATLVIIVVLFVHLKFYNGKRCSNQLGTVSQKVCVKCRNF